MKIEIFGDGRLGNNEAYGMYKYNRCVMKLKFLSYIIVLKKRDYSYDTLNQYYSNTESYSFCISMRLKSKLIKYLNQIRINTLSYSSDGKEICRILKIQKFRIKKISVIFSYMSLTSIEFHIEKLNSIKLQEHMFYLTIEIKNDSFNHYCPDILYL
jgi:hypothetical protein